MAVHHGTWSIKVDEPWTTNSPPISWFSFIPMGNRLALCKDGAHALSEARGIIFAMGKLVFLRLSGPNEYEEMDIKQISYTNWISLFVFFYSSSSLPWTLAVLGSVEEIVWVKKDPHVQIRHSSNLPKRGSAKTSAEKALPEPLHIGPFPASLKYSILGQSGKHQLLKA